MKNYTIETESKTIPFTIYHAKAVTSGYGRKIINVEIYINGKYAEFGTITTNMQDYDRATEFEGQELYEALYEMVKYNIDELIKDYIYFNEA